MIYHGDLFDVLPTLDAESVDACVTDPPYGIGFMGREWDTFRPGEAERRIVPNRAMESDNPNLKGRMRGPASSPSAVEYDRSLRGQREFQLWTEQWAREVYRVLKPGAYLLVCGAPRSYHRMACGIEDAGFVVRDCLTWLYGSGFPKSLNLPDGRGTALKPAWEPIVLARKPTTGTVAQNVAQHGTGALNIDACRLGPMSPDDPSRRGLGYGFAKAGQAPTGMYSPGVTREYDDSKGRWPPNVLLDERAAAELDAMTGELSSHGGGTSRGIGYGSTATAVAAVPIGDSGGASRFFYIAKPSREERDYGCDGLELKTAAEITGRAPGSAGLNNPRSGIRAGSAHRDEKARIARNVHPTVKPLELMRWLVRLVTPPGGTVLDPFAGSGTTGMACRYELRPFIGIEREAEYVAIAERRIAACVPLFGEAVS